MKIAICASEGAPYAKSGGLGDVMEALPSALARIAGNEVVLFLPYYHKIKTNTAYMVERVAEIFSYLDDAEPYLKELPSEKAAKVVSNMDSDDAVDALDGLEEEDKAKIVGRLDKLRLLLPGLSGRHDRPELHPRNHPVQRLADRLHSHLSQGHVPRRLL